MDDPKTWACMAANGTDSLMFTDDVTADGMNSEAYRAILSVDVQPNASELTGWCFMLQVDNDTKHPAKAGIFF